MPDLEYIKPGDRKIPALTFNTMVDAARLFRERMNDREGDSAGVSGHDTTTVLVRNNGDRVDRFGILGITGMMVDEETNPDTFATRPSLTADTPDPATHTAFVVTREPIKKDEAGRATIAGITPVKVDVVDEDHIYCTMTNESAHLLSVAAGPHQILWKAAGTGVQWALVRLGGGTAGLVLVDLEEDGGSAGDDTSPCSFTYTVSLNGTTLETDVDPLFARPALGAMTAATHGLARLNGDTLVLVCTDEVPEMATCDATTGFSDE